MAKLLTLLSVIGVVILVYGLIVLNPWATLCGLSFTITMKVWFVDRMVWMYDECQASA